jgi:hypothetical protein
VKSIQIMNVKRAKSVPVDFILCESFAIFIRIVLCIALVEMIRLGGNLFK